MITAVIFAASSSFAFLFYVFCHFEKVLGSIDSQITKKLLEWYQNQPSLEEALFEVSVLTLLLPVAVVLIAVWTKRKGNIPIQQKSAKKRTFRRKNIQKNNSNVIRVYYSRVDYFAIEIKKREEAL